MERIFFFENWSDFVDFPFSWKRLVLDTGLEKVCDRCCVVTSRPISKVEKKQVAVFQSKS